MLFIILLLKLRCLQTQADYVNGDNDVDESITFENQIILIFLELNGNCHKFTTSFEKNWSRFVELIIWRKGFSSSTLLDKLNCLFVWNHYTPIILVNFGKYIRHLFIAKKDLLFGF